MKKILLPTIGIFLLIVFALNRDILAQSLNGDVNKDGQVNFADYQLIQSLYGTITASADFNMNGIVDLFDVNTVIANIYLKQNATATPTPPTSDPTSTPKPPTATTKPTSGVTVPPTSNPSPTKAVPSPTSVVILPTTPPNPGSNQIGDLVLTYTKGGIWLTQDEILQIPKDNDDWKKLETYAGEALTLDKDLHCTAGGDYGCTADAKTPKRILARAIVGIRNNDSAMIDGLKAYLNTDVPAAIYANSNKLADEKWAERNLGPIAVAANIIDHRPKALLDSLKAALYEWKFCKSTYPCQDAETIYYKGLHYLTNLPSWGRWSVFTTAYLLEDWDTVNAVAKAEAKMLGEPLWNGQPNNAPIQYTGGGASEEWHKLPAVGGRILLVMPAGATYVYDGQTRYIGGLYIGDMWRSSPTLRWPPVKNQYSNYIWEGMAPNVSISWAAHHLGYKDVFKWGDYALLRAAIFNYSTHDGKAAVKAEDPDVNDEWQNAALMAWAKSEIGPVLPDRLKPDPRVAAVWPLPVWAGTEPGRGMGFMYATHYARLVR